MFPKLSTLPRDVIFNSAWAFGYAWITKANPKMMVAVCAISTIVDRFLFAFANPLFKGDLGIRSLKVLIATHAVVLAITLIALKQLELIGKIGLALILGLELTVLSFRLATLYVMYHPEIYNKKI